MALLIDGTHDLIRTGRDSGWDLEHTAAALVAAGLSIADAHAFAGFAASAQDLARLGQKRVDLSAEQWRRITVQRDGETSTAQEPSPGRGP
jgi:hypothetical protein